MHCATASTHAFSRRAPSAPSVAAPAPAPARGLREWLLRSIRSRLQPHAAEEECEERLFPRGRYRPEGPAALARVTRFTPREIKLMYRGFKQECPSGMVDEETFKHIFGQFFPLGDASQYAHFVFNTIQHKQSGKVNFEEYLSIVSRVARGTLQEKLSWIFALYDRDGDGRISQHEMVQVAQAVYELLGTSAPEADHCAAAEHAHKIFHMMDTNSDGAVTLEELSQWLCRQPELMTSLETLDTVL